MPEETREFTQGFVALQITTKTVNDKAFAELSHGDIEYSFGSQSMPKTHFDSYEEAINYCKDTDPGETWIILPTVSWPLKW